MNRILAVVAACLVALACGGVQTSVPGSSQISSLSADQTKQLCRDRQKYFETAYSTAERKTFSCSLGSLIAGSVAAAFSGPDAGVAACQMGFTQCEAGSGSSSDGGTADPCANVTADSTCAATVSDLNSCYVEQLESLRPFTKGQQCTSLTSSDGGSPTSTKSTTCDKIASSCERAKSFSW